MHRFNVYDASLHSPVRPFMLYKVGRQAGRQAYEIQAGLCNLDGSAALCVPHPFPPPSPMGTVERLIVDAHDPPVPVAASSATQCSQGQLPPHIPVAVRCAASLVHPGQVAPEFTSPQTAAAAAEAAAAAAAAAAGTPRASELAAVAGALVAGPADPYRWPLPQDSSGMESVRAMFNHITTFLNVLVGKGGGKAGRGAGRGAGRW